MHKESLFEFEKYCSSCDNFRNKEKCPYFEVVTENTQWEEINCNNFWD